MKFEVEGVKLKDLEKMFRSEIDMAFEKKTKVIALL